MTVTDYSVTGGMKYWCHFDADMKVKMRKELEGAGKRLKIFLKMKTKVLFKHFLNSF